MLPRGCRCAAVGEGGKRRPAGSRGAPKATNSLPHDYMQACLNAMALKMELAHLQPYGLRARQEATMAPCQQGARQGCVSLGGDACCCPGFLQGLRKGLSAPEKGKADHDRLDPLWAARSIAMPVPTRVASIEASPAEEF
uniref:Uncharacterized protein n=1 Tax=Sphaerodactylus townsendi TaxID=933632 RepID=A0ACB8E719_9SAUR